MTTANDWPLWSPTTTMDALKQRAQILTAIRAFFAERHVLEVETPLWSQAGVTAPYLASMTSLYHPPGMKAIQGFLQTSPEYAMKRLLTAGSGCIYQITKAFRDGELGRFHNPEFTLLEWYRIGFDHLQLLTEVITLIQTVAKAPDPLILSYADAFQQACHIDVHVATLADLQVLLATHRLDTIEGIDLSDRDLCLQLLMSEVVEKQFVPDQLTVILDFPASQAALARVLPGNPPVAARFEIYWHGVELANGFYELTDAQEQRARFQADLAKRHLLGLPSVPIDERLLAALEQGLPDCAGVALGLDRLVMCAIGAKALREVIAFPWQIA